MALFVEQKERELELAVAGALVNAPLLEGLERVLDKPVSSGALDAKDSACGAVAELGYGEEGVILDKRGRVVAYRKGWKTYLFCVVAAISVRLSFGLSFRLSFTLSPDFTSGKAGSIVPSDFWPALNKITFHAHPCWSDL